MPGRLVESSELDLKLGLKSGTLESLSGVQRRWFTQGENAAQAGAKAARIALERAGLKFSDIDLLLAVSGTSDQIIPSNAALILQELDPDDTGIPCFDINSTCLSFVVGLDTISFAIAAGRYRRVLIVAAELGSLGLNPKELEAYSLFGDAAIAVVVEKAGPDQSSRILGARQESYSSGAENCNIYGGAGRLPAYHYNEQPPERYLFHMDGPKLFKQSSAVMPDFLGRLLADSGTALKEIQLIIPHQASASAMELLRRKLKLSKEQVVSTLRDCGNNIAASIPLAMDEALQQGRLKRGDRVLFLGTSAGFSIGGMVLEY
jgi:3-oxoacyl-[acyl-carrier-protein] synthase-3